jgi:hypothetical protein
MRSIALAGSRRTSRADDGNDAKPPPYERHPNNGQLWACGTERTTIDYFLARELSFKAGSTSACARGSQA